MSKAILVANRPGTDKQTGGDVLWLSLYMCPREYTKTDGSKAIYYQKTTEGFRTVCISKDTMPDSYAKLKDVREGSLMVVRYSVNELTGNARISDVDLVPGTNKYTPDLLYRD